jgi:hypothetical protein
LQQTERTDPISLMEEALEAMLLDDEDITARGLVRRMVGVFKYATDITRPTDRRALLEQYQTRQRELRTVISKADKTSKANLSARIVRKDEEIETLRRQRDLLVASHRAMILAIGEMGGMKIWKRFFEAYQAAEDELHALGAMPTATVTPLVDRSPGKGRQDH